MSGNAAEKAQGHEIRYWFTFPDGTGFEYAVDLDPTTYLSLPKKGEDHPQWALLERNRCPNCTLDAGCVYCPIAANLADIVAAFNDHLSYQEVRVCVTTAQRSFAAETSLALGLGSLIGLVMATSGCPVLDHFRPMARFHLPFASVEETEYRMVSMYLMAQYFLQAQGLAADLELNGLKRICEEVADVNAAFALRLREAADTDANVNSLIYLDCFTKATPQAVRQGMKDYRACFESYFS